MKSIKFSQYSLDKIKILRKHGIIVNKKMAKDIILDPQKVEKGYKEKISSAGKIR